jgi:SAM-dependent methyltransferase
MTQAKADDLARGQSPGIGPVRHPTDAELRANFRIKHGDPAQTGWSPRRRVRFGYWRPEDVYEALVTEMITAETDWIDIGGGRGLFPHNEGLTRQLAERCRRLVGVDPSPNIHENPFVHEKAQCLIEDFDTDATFDLATFRMVVEHVEDPARVVRKLRAIVRPGGRVVVLTVDLWAPITVLSRATPYWLHYPLKKLFWGGDESDTFPTVYRMNTRKTLRDRFDAGGFREVFFAHVDDCSTFGSINALNLVELGVWRVFHSLGMRYPENCLLAVYERSLDATETNAHPMRS